MQSYIAPVPTQHHMYYAQQGMPASQCVTASQSNHESMGRNPEHLQEPLSAYARWKKEEDEIFYQTFPQARYAAQHYAMIYDGCYYDTRNSLTLDEPSYPNSLAVAYRSNDAISHNGQRGPFDYDEQFSTAHETTVVATHKVIPLNYSAMSISKALQDPTSCSGQGLTEVRVVPQPAQQEPPLMDFLPPPSPASTSSSFGSPLASSPEYHQSTTYHDQNPKAASPESYSPDDHYSLSPPPPQTSLYNCYPPTGPSPLQPNGWPVTRAPSPRGMRLSPLSPSRRPLAKKPPLACLFCRGRKIACGPPDPGSSDRSCNQCQRRNIKCEYPLESRRGMRKKKDHVTRISARPRVKLGRKARVQ